MNNIAKEKSKIEMDSNTTVENILKSLSSQKDVNAKVYVMDFSSENKENVAPNDQNKKSPTKLANVANKNSENK